MLTPDGVLSFISSNKWLRANYGKKIRNYIAKKCHILSITDFGELPVFETSATFPMVFVAQKIEINAETIFTQVKTLDPPYPDVKAIIQQNGSNLPADAIKGDKWILTDAETLRMLRTMESAGIPLKKYVKGEIYYGIKTGFNKAFVIDSTKREELIADDPTSNDLIKRMIIGDDVRKWYIRDKNRWMIVTPIGVEINNFPAIFKHLKRWKEDLQKRKDQGNHWWELRACNYYNKVYSKKILIPAFAMTPRFCLDSSDSVVNAPCYFISSQDIFLLGILNSTPAFKFLQLICTVLGDESARGRVVLRPIYFSQLPIPNASAKEKKVIEKLVQRCLDAEGENCEQWEKEIDKIVTKLYGLEG